MDIITLTKDNLAEEHICCAIASRGSNDGIAAKKQWLACQLNNGLKFKKLNARGKVFIEYIPADYAWVPIDAAGYVFINCHWVSGSFKGHGYGKRLLEECEQDAKSTNGVVVTVGKKKTSFLSDKSFLIKHGYEVCDTCSPNFELLVKRFNSDATLPKFKESAKNGLTGETRGIDIFYTAQCPFTVPYIEFIKPIVELSDYPVRIHHLQTKEDAQSHCCPVTTYSVFVDGKYYTNEILTPSKLEKLIYRFKVNN